LRKAGYHLPSEAAQLDDLGEYREIVEAFHRIVQRLEQNVANRQLVEQPIFGTIPVDRLLSLHGNKVRRASALSGEIIEVGSASNDGFHGTIAGRSGNRSSRKARFVVENAKPLRSMFQFFVVEMPARWLNDSQYDDS
jgi:hypothetical protein